MPLAQSYRNISISPWNDACYLFSDESQNVNPYLFPMEECVLAIASGGVDQTLKCRSDPDHVVPLAHLVPDVALQVPLLPLVIVMIIIVIN